MSEAEHIAAQTATANHAVDLDQKLHERRDIEVLYRIYMEKRLASQAAFYESRVRENQSNADFTFVLSTVIMALSAFVATIGAFGESPVFSLMSAILPAFAALLAAFRQLYGWERQISIYRDALLGLERVKLITPDKDRMVLSDLPAIYPKLVNSGESIFTGEVNQWGQFVQNADKEETTDERTMNTMMGSLQLTDAQIETIRKIVAAGTPKAAFSQQTITVHPEETSALPAGNGGGVAAPPPADPNAAVPVVLTTTVSDSASEAKVVEHTIPPEGLDDPIEDVVPPPPPESFPTDAAPAPAESEYTVNEDAGTAAETFPVENYASAETGYTTQTDVHPTHDAEFPVTEEAAAPADPQFPVMEDAVPEGDIQTVVWEEEQPPPPEAFSALSPGALHVDAPQDPPEGTFTEEEDPNANG